MDKYNLPAFCRTALWDLVLLPVALDALRPDYEFTEEDRGHFKRYLSVVTLLPSEHLRGERPPAIYWHVPSGIGHDQTVELSPDNVAKHFGALWPYVSAMILSSASPCVRFARHRLGLEIDMLMARYDEVNGILSDKDRDNVRTESIHRYRPAYYGGRTTNQRAAVSIMLAMYCYHQFLLRNAIELPQYLKSDPMAYRYGCELPTPYDVQYAIDDVASNRSHGAPEYLMPAVNPMHLPHTFRAGDDVGSYYIEVWGAIRESIYRANAPAINDLRRHFAAEIASMDAHITERNH